MHSPTVVHWMACKRVLSYFYVNKHFGLQFRPPFFHQLYRYTDIDWASCPNDHWSMGYYIFHDENVVSWSSRK